MKRRGTIVDALFSGGLYLALAAACMSNLRLTPSGPALMLREGGYPFLYELGIAVVLLATLLALFQGVLVLSARKKLMLLGLTLFYVPIFLNYFLGSLDIRQFVGGGQLRLQLEVWLLGVAMILYPVSKRTVHRAMIVVVVMALANGLYAIACFQGLVRPMYEVAFRGPGNLRQSGFFKMPASLGVLSAVAVAWSLWLAPKKSIAATIVCVCGLAAIAADSRTGMIAIVIVVISRILSHHKILKNITTAFWMIFFFLAAALVAFASIPNTIWSGIRIRSILNVIPIWLNNPLGVPWGTFAKVDSFYGHVVLPHNWLAVSLLYGGALSFFAAVTAHVFLLRMWLRNRGVRSSNGRFQAALVLILIAITVSACFEQVLMSAFAAFTFVMALGTLTHSWPDRSERSKKQEAYSRTPGAVPESSK